MCLLKQIFKRGFPTFKNITHNLFFSFQSSLYQEKNCAKERTDFGGMFWLLEKSCFFFVLFSTHKLLSSSCVFLFIFEVSFVLVREVRRHVGYQ